MFGAALAGGLIALWGVSVALLVDAASFAVIAIVLAAAKDLPQPEHEDRTPWHERYVDGLEFARDNRLVRTLLVGQSLALDLLHDRRPDRGHLRQGEPGDDRAPASACCCPPGAPGS